MSRGWKTLWKKSLCPDDGEVRLSLFVLSTVDLLYSLFAAASKIGRSVLIPYPLVVMRSKNFLVILP